MTLVFPDKFAGWMPGIDNLQSGADPNETPHGANTELDKTYIDSGHPANRSGLVTEIKANFSENGGALKMGYGKLNGSVFTPDGFFTLISGASLGVQTFKGSLGPELVPDFDMKRAGVSDWAPSGNTLTKTTIDPYIGTQSLRALRAGVSSNRAYAQPNLILVNGESYLVDVVLRKDKTTRYAWLENRSSDQIGDLIGSLEWVRQVLVYTANVVDDDLHIRTFDEEVGSCFEVGYFSVRKINNFVPFEIEKGDYLMAYSSATTKLALVEDSPLGFGSVAGDKTEDASFSVTLETDANISLQTTGIADLEPTKIEKDEGFKQGERIKADAWNWLQHAQSAWVKKTLGGLFSHFKQTDTISANMVCGAYHDLNRFYFFGGLNQINRTAFGLDHDTVNTDSYSWLTAAFDGTNIIFAANTGTIRYSGNSGVSWSSNAAGGNVTSMAASLTGKIVTVQDNVSGAFARIAPDISGTFVSSTNAPSPNTARQVLHLSGSTFFALSTTSTKFDLSRSDDDGDNWVIEFAVLNFTYVNGHKFDVNKGDGRIIVCRSDSVLDTVGNFNISDDIGGGTYVSKRVAVPYIINQVRDLKHIGGPIWVMIGEIQTSTFEAPGMYSIDNGDSWQPLNFYESPNEGSLVVGDNDFIATIGQAVCKSKRFF